MLQKSSQGVFAAQAAEPEASCMNNCKDADRGDNSAHCPHCNKLESPLETAANLCSQSTNLFETKIISFVVNEDQFF